LVARSKVNNPDQYKKYTDSYQAFSKSSAQDPWRAGGKFKILEAGEIPTLRRHRVPSFEKAVACHESPEYLEAAAHRKKDGAAELEIVIVESI